MQGQTKLDRKLQKKLDRKLQKIFEDMNVPNLEKYIVFPMNQLNEEANSNHLELTAV